MLKAHLTIGRCFVKIKLYKQRPICLNMVSVKRIEERQELKMHDYYRQTISRLLECNYDIFLPAQQQYGHEIVVSNGDWLKRLLIRTATTDKNQGPAAKLQITKNKQTYLIDGLAVDGVLCCWPLNGDVWLIPIDEAIGKETIRLAHRDDLLISPIQRFDGYLSKETQREIVSIMKAQYKFEQKSIDASATEQKFYADILKGN